MALHARIKRTPPPDGARRRWWQNRLLQLLAAFVLLCGVAAAGLKLYTDYTNSHFQVTFYRVTSSHVSEKLRVLFLSDLHLREYGENNEELIQTVQELDPDLILLGGDLVTFPNPEYENMLSLCRSLADSIRPHALFAGCSAHFFVCRPSRPAPRPPPGRWPTRPNCTAPGWPPPE